MFGSRRSRETNPVYVEDVRFSETSPIKFVGIRPRESKSRSKFVWLLKAKGNESYIYIYIYTYIYIFCVLHQGVG